MKVFVVFLQRRYLKVSYFNVAILIGVASAFFGLGFVFAASTFVFLLRDRAEKKEALILNGERFWITSDRA